MSQLRLIVTAIFIAATLIAGATGLSDETLQYKVLYKWGLIHKQAGTATFSLRTSDKYYQATMVARSAGWADKFYHLRDTLRSKMTVDDYSPVMYERIAHEAGKYARDKLVFSHSGNTFSATGTRWRKGKNDKQMSVSTKNLTAQGMTVDLLSSFYYLRSMSFGTMNPGKTIRVNIFSGKKKELLTIRYAGVTTLKHNGKEHQTYKVTFTFTSDGKKETSDPIEAWISTDERHTPLKLVGKLKVGQIQCIYSGI